jgi:predicted phosphodiesterase
MDNKWTNEEKAIVNDLLAEHKMYCEISEQLKTYGFDRSPEAVRKMIGRSKNERVGFVDEITSPVVEDTIKLNQKKRTASKETLPIFDEYELVLQQIQEKKQLLLQASNKRFEKLGNPGKANYKVLAISDLHIPFENTDVINHALKNHGDADALVINGDLFDMYSVSKWPKNKSVLLEHEYKLVFDYIKMFAETFKEVHITKGNHDARLQSYFSSHIDPAISFITHPDAIERISLGYNVGPSGHLDKVCDFNNVFYSSGPYAWYTKIGDVIFAHPNNGGKAPMRTGVGVAEYFNEREDFSTVVVGHSHRMGSVFWRNKLVIEQGCCCLPQEYEADAKMQYGMQTFGYAVLYMNNEGKVDFDRSRPVYYGTGSIMHFE